MCRMKPCGESLSILQKLISITLFTVVLEAQQIQVWPEVTGYLGQVVTLPCTFIQGPNNGNITQFQWEFMPPKGEKIKIIVFNSQYGLAIPESPLKERVEITEQSLTIKDVELNDTGSYTCSISTFPSGTFAGTTNLTVKRQNPLSSWVIAAIVTAVVLLVGILAAVAYLIFIRHSSSDRNVCIDTGGLVAGVAQHSVLRDEVSSEDVVYSDVKLKQSRDATRSPDHIHTEDVHGAEVTYAEVVVLRQQPR